MEFESWLAVILAAAPIKEPLMPLWAMELMVSVFLYVWLFCLGASVGSFLNVVIYRLPRGKSLVHPGSICPHCGHAIRLHDNIPILSWLALRGRCRDCQGPIASRYFFVELTVATIFLVVALIETKLTGGFPRRNWDATRWLISPYDTLPFWSTYGLHVILLTTLLGAALIDYDGSPTPGRIFLPVAAVGLMLAAIWPLIHPQSAAPHGLMAGLGGWLIGLAVGAVIGEFWAWSTGRGWPRFAPVGMLVAVGVVMGWRSLLEVAAVAMTLQVLAMLVLRLSRASQVAPFAAFILIAALPRLLDVDVRLNAPLRWPANYDGTAAALCLVIIVLATAAAGLLAPPQYFAQHAAETSSSENSPPS